MLESTYGYDVNSNRTSYDGQFGTVLPADVTVDARDRLLAYDDLTFTYTDAGELLTKTQSGQTVEYDYDVFGNLKSVDLPGGTEIEYVTDGANRRIGKKINGTLVQGFLYQDALNPIAELDGSGNVVSRFVYATRANVPDYMIQGGVTYRIVTDHLGSVRLVVDIATGAIAQEMRYDEFGRVTLDTGPGFQPFGFAGGLYDAQTGLVRFGARDYDPDLGRWTKVDPIRFRSGDSNFYSYSAQNPVNQSDPSGLAVGHHFMPRAVFGRIEGLSDEARKVFNGTTTGGPIPGGHGWSREHKQYNDAVEELWQDWARQNEIDPSKMTKNQAREFLEQIGRSRNPAIRGFLDGISKQMGRNVLESLGKKAGGALCRKIPVVAASLFLYDMSQGGVGHAVNELTWPVSEIWN